MTIKMLNEVMRNPKLYAQTKAIYSYLYVRADHKTNLSYPSKQQMRDEIRLTDNLLTEGLRILENNAYIRQEIKTGKDAKTGKEYTYSVYTLIDKFNNEVKPDAKQIK